AQMDADLRRAGRPRIADGITLEFDVMMMAEDDDGGSGEAGFQGRAVVQNRVVLERVAMSAHRLGLVAGQDARARILRHSVVAEEIVCVAMPDGDAVALVAAELIPFEQAMPDAPADKKAVLFIAERLVVAENGMLRPAARMKAQARVVFADAVLDHGVVR